MRFILFFFLLTSKLFALNVPDTTKIPAKWKNESIIVLEHFYHAEESNFDNARYSESIKIVYYIRDKYGLEQLSTLNIPTYIVPGAEMQVGKIYKKNKTTLDLTSKHLIPMFTKIDIGNNRRNSSTHVRDDGQKLAIPSLEVGDILEIEYTSRRKEAITYLNLSVNYPTLHSDLSVSILGDEGGVASNIQYKAVNFPESKIEATPFTVKVMRDEVDKILEYPLSDENRNVPYVLIWKKNLKYMENSTFGNLSEKKYSQMNEEEIKKEQLAFISYIYQDEAYQSIYADNLLSLLNKKHDKIADTVSFLNDLFFYYREYIAKRSLTESASSKRIETKDVFFINVVSRVLTEKKIPYKVLITQPDYYGAPESERSLVNIRYGFVLPQLHYYLFNPYFYSLPNQIPAYFEDQQYMSFKANAAYYPSGCGKKNCTYGFSFDQFPHSSAEQNLTHSDIQISAFDLKSQKCKMKVKIAYSGKNKNRMTKSLCSKTYLYERENNEYRSALIKKGFINDSPFKEQEKHNKYLEKFLLDDTQGDGYDTEKLNAYSIEETYFFIAEKPLVTQVKFEINNLFNSFENYLVLNVGKLLGNQLSYQQKDVPRQNDFYIPYKKKYEFSINIEIPQNYQIENLSDLNSKFESPAGKFESKATIEGDKLYITTEKTYNFIDYLKKDEKDISGFLNAATDFVQKKLILKKSS